MLTRDKGWYKPVLLLAVSLLVPVAGPLAVLGYQLEWARLTAWNVDSAPKQTNVDVGGCIKTGGSRSWSSLVWGLALGVAESLVSWIFSFNSSVQSFVLFLVFLCNIVLGIVIIIAEVRATVYQKITPGFQLNRIWEMVRHDFGGVMRIFGIRILGSLVACGAAVVAGLVLFVSYLPAVINATSLASSYSSGLSSYGTGLATPYGYGYGYGTGSSAAVRQIVAALLQPFSNPLFVILLVLVVYLLVVIGVTFALLTYNAVGLWMRQFDVVSWGKSADPMPAPLPTTDGSQAPQNPGQPDSQTPQPPSADVQPAPVAPAQQELPSPEPEPEPVPEPALEPAPEPADGGQPAPEEELVVAEESAQASEDPTVRTAPADVTEKLEPAGQEELPKDDGENEAE
jgi:hypothetical protein